MRRLDIAIKHRLGDLLELFSSMSAPSIPENSASLFYLSRHLKWRSLGHALCLQRLFQSEHRRRVALFNAWVRRRFDENNRFHGEGFILELPPEFPNAREVVINDLREIYLENHYTEGFPFGRLIRDNDVVLDCGSNIGAFAIYATSCGRNIRVLAFEPEPTIYRALVHNVELNNLESQVQCFPFGLTDEVGNFGLRFRADSFTENQLTGRVSEGGVQCVTIDSAVSSAGLTRCDVIKMDIEGAERLALAGASDTLKKFHPRLSIAAYHIPSDPFVLSSMVRRICPEYNVVVTAGAHLSAFHSANA